MGVCVCYPNSDGWYTAVWGLRMAFGSVEVLLYYEAGISHPTPAELQPFLTAPDDIVDIVGHYNVYPADNVGNVGSAAGVPNSALITMVHGRGKKIVLLVGGGDILGQYTGRFSAIVQSETAMDRFVGQVMDVVDSGGYDGIDLDWEFPGTNADQQGFANLIYKFVRALNPAWPGKSGKTLSVGVQINDYNGTYIPTTIAPQNSVLRFPDIPPGQPAMHYLDWYGVQTYGHHGPSFSNHSGHAGAIHSTSGDNTKHDPYGPPNVHTPSFDSALTYWLGRTVPRSKIRLGIGFYGVQVLTVSTLLGAVPGWPTPDPGTTKSYAEIQDILDDGGWTAGFDSAAIAAYYTSSPGFISGPTPVTVQASLRFAAAEHLPGMIAWAAGKDWVNNQQPLLKAMQDATGRLRSVWVGARDFVASGPGASLAVVGSTGSENRPVVWVFPASSGVITAAVTLPEGWLSAQSIVPVLHWSRGAGTNGVVGWNMRTAVIDVGDQVDEATATLLDPGPSVGPVTPEALALTPMGGIQPSAARTLRIAIERVPASLSGWPSFTGDAWVMGLELQYVSAT